MNNPLLYPFLAICIVFALAFAVWCYYAIRSAREKRVAQRFVSVGLPIAQSVVREVALRKSVSLSGAAPMYRHRGHIHAAAKRGPNRADRRAEKQS